MSPPARELPVPTKETPLLLWLVGVLKPMNRTRVKQLLRSGRVLVNGVSTSRHDYPVRQGDKLTIVSERVALPRGDRPGDGIPILHFDEAIIALDKPAGLLTVATESEKIQTAFVWLKTELAQRRAGRPFVVHRLDRDTSGLLIFARTESVKEKLHENWDRLRKTYLAVVDGGPKEREGTVDNYLLEGQDLRVRLSGPAMPGAKRAVTRYQVVASAGGHSLVEVQLETGRKHQIRVHMAGLGCPISGDKIYGSADGPADRLALHAWKLGFDHPDSEKRVDLEAPVPSSLRNAFRKLFTSRRGSDGRA